MLVPFRAGAQVIGALRPDFAQALRGWPAVFAFDAGGVALVPADERRRSDALAEATRELARTGWIQGWRGELYAVHAPGGGPLFCIERAAMRRFGLLSRAAHANVVSGQGARRRMWIARRSAAKPIDPGLWDTLVGGGIAAGLSAWQTLLKEAREEAGIEAARARRARFVKALMIERIVPEGLHREILFVYDLEVGAGFRPRNLDGEVSAFERSGCAGLVRRLAQGAFTAEAALIVHDWLARAGAGRPALRRALARSERLAARAGAGCTGRASGR